MKWTKTIPKQPGYYWARAPRQHSMVYGGALTPKKPPFIVHVDHDGDACVCGNDMMWKPKCGEYWWWPVEIMPPNAIELTGALKARPNDRRE